MHHTATRIRSALCCACILLLGPRVHAITYAGTTTVSFSSNPVILVYGNDVTITAVTTSAASSAIIDLGTVDIEMALDNSDLPVPAASAFKWKALNPSVLKPISGVTSYTIELNGIPGFTRGTIAGIRATYKQPSGGTKVKSHKSNPVDITAVREMIAFHSFRDGNYEIYAMTTDGGSQTNLTSNSGYDQYPSFSADGTKIAFWSSRSGTGQLYVMNTDGSSAPVPIAPTPYAVYAWSPVAGDNRIAYLWNKSNPPSQFDQEIAVVNSDGTNNIELTNDTYTDILGSWSADGTTIAFNSNNRPGGSGGVDIWTVPSNGSSAPSPLIAANTSDGEVYPMYSPDGTKLAFWRGYPTLGISILDLASSSVTILASGSGPAFWSPNSMQIAYFPGTANTINVISASGGVATTITSSGVFDNYRRGSPWSPDGSSFIYRNPVNDRLVKVDTATWMMFINLTASGSRDEAPAWSPP